jgi:hypothetical protein
MRVLWMLWRSFWFDFFHPFISFEERFDYGKKLGEWYWRKGGKEKT